MLRSVSQSFSRIAELLGLIVETTLSSLTEKGGNEKDLPKLFPLKDGLAVAQQSIKEVGEEEGAEEARRRRRCLTGGAAGGCVVHRSWRCWLGCWRAMRTCWGCC